ncbi:hypothetical protein B7494_g5172 [Chlorociboria aeruginascens]|nr:hypothetical protein B7494_g5172 [Chlorociboria aeruginascens]
MASLDHKEDHDLDEKYIEDNEKPTLPVGDNVPTTHNTALTRRILFKLDFRILPVLTLLFLCSFLDRTNVGNAKTYKLETSLKMNDNQYDTGLAVYYATYIASEIPSNLVLKKISPKIWLPLLTIAWGIVTMCLGFVQNKAGFMAVRAVLGITEGGLLPGIVLYLSEMYTRGEMALRLGLFYTAASLSGAFGVFKRPIFLSEEEKIFQGMRIHVDVPARLREDGLDHQREVFKWSEVGRGIFSISTWLSAFSYFGILAGLYSFGLFLPTIIVELGYTANQAQLWSVIPYAVAAVVTVIVSFISDYLKLRGVIMLFCLIPAIVGYAVIANISVAHTKVKYGMTFLMATGLYSGVPCVLGWNSNNSAGHYKRATTTALQLMIANCGGFVATFIYPNVDKPQFHLGHTVILGLLVASWFMVLANVLYCAKVNRDKKVGKYAQYAGYGDDRDPEFRLVL